MSDALSALRHLLYRPWLLASLAALASAILLLLASIGVAMHQIQVSESEQMNARGERFLERLEQIFGQLREGVDELQAQPIRGCDASMLRTLQEVAFRYRFVYEAAYVDGTVACSNRIGEQIINPLRPRISRGLPTVTGSTPPPSRTTTLPR